MRYSLQDEYGYSDTIRYVRIAGVRILYAENIMRTENILLNYSTVRVQYEYSRTSSSTVRVREGG